MDEMFAQSFAHIGINCKDPIATERYYTRYFGFRRARVIPSEGKQIVFLKTDKGDLYLELFEATEEASVPPNIKDGPVCPGFRHLAFKVGNVDKKLKEMGPDVKITQGPFNFDEIIPGWRTVWIADPDGRIIEISQGYKDQENPSKLCE